MKKLFAILLAILMIFGTMPMSIQAVGYTEETVATTASSVASNIYLTDYYAPYYFYSLKRNYGDNMFGSCVAVATAMLLSYYDTYWDDDIIPEVYDVPVSMDSSSFQWDNSYSPGILQESYSDFSDCETMSEAIAKYEELSSTHFHSYLISKCVDLGFYQGRASTPVSLGVTPEQQKTLLTTYLEEAGFSDLSVYYVEDDISDVATQRIKNQAISLIRQGHPVCLAIQQPIEDANGNITGYQGHAALAYDYDESTDTIYTHMGSLSAWRHVNPVDFNYSYFNALLAVIPEIGWEHNCSNNYQYTSEDVTTTHCPCEVGLHPAHIHDEYTTYSSTIHAFACRKCNMVSYNEEHDYRTYTINSVPTMNTKHRACCPCGYYRVESHLVRAPADGPIMFPATCILCGLQATSGDVVLVNIPPELEQMGVQSTPGSYTLSDGTTIQILTANGSYVLPNGIIVLSEADAALMDLGLLDPYELVESPTIPSNPGHVTE